MVSPLELTARAEGVHFWFRGFERFVVPCLEEIAAGRSRLRLIDCGAGTGYNVALLRSFGKVFAFDLDPTSLHRARAASAPVVRADISRVPFLSETFDVTTAFDVLQCTANDATAVQEMARVTRKGGFVVASVPAFEALRGDHSESWQETRRYTPSMLRRLVRDAGLEPVRVSFLFASLLPLMFAARLWQRLTRPFRELKPDADIRVPSPLVNRLLTGLVHGEAALARYCPMPVGSSLLVVARKG